MRSEHRKEIEELVEILSQENLTEIEVERKDVRIRIRRELPSLSSSNPHPVVSSDTGKSSEVVVGTPVGESSRFLTVTSPIVGTFYRAPSPEADPEFNISLRIISIVIFSSSKRVLYFINPWESAGLRSISLYRSSIIFSF